MPKKLGKVATQSVCVVIVGYDFVNGPDYAQEGGAVKSYFHKNGNNKDCGRRNLKPVLQ
jgi:hypothetical protein